MTQHGPNCTCGMQGKRVSLDKFIDMEKVKELRIINNRVDCANQALRASAIPDGVSDTKVKLFIAAAIEALADYTTLMSEWWDVVRAQYGFDDGINVYVDFKTGELYYFDTTTC